MGEPSSDSLTPALGRAFALENPLPPIEAPALLGPGPAPVPCRLELDDEDEPILPMSVWEW